MNTEHVEEHGLQQPVELGDGFVALGAQRVGLVQNRRDAALFEKRRQRNLTAPHFGEVICVPPILNLQLRQIVIEKLWV